MPVELQSRLSELLQRVEGVITPTEQHDLQALNTICELENLHKARGVAEAVRRGLRARLS